MCGKQIRKGAKIIDVGTDHGYLPIWIAMKNITSSIIASDINYKPLLIAKENIKRYKVRKNIKLMLSDGLKEISKNEVEDIIIAGMGGDTIIKIIDDTPWLKDSSKHLILQPMTNEERVRKFLSLSGFYSLNESVIRSDGRIYVVMTYCYTGKIVQNDTLFQYIGSVPEMLSEVNYEYLKRVVRHLKNKGKSKSSDKNISGVISKIEEVINSANR